MQVQIANIKRAQRRYIRLLLLLSFYISYLANDRLWACQKVSAVFYLAVGKQFALSFWFGFLKQAFSLVYIYIKRRFKRKVK